MVNESGGGAASEVEGFYNLSFNEPYNNFTIMNIDADKSAKVMFGSETRVLNPGDEWRRFRNFGSADRNTNPVEVGFWITSNKIKEDF